MDILYLCMRWDGWGDALPGLTCIRGSEESPVEQDPSRTGRQQIELIKFYLGLFLCLREWLGIQSKYDRGE
jgi:hypothetical protein